jgi:tetratricopeptide (TPR) repeat protein
MNINKGTALAIMLAVAFSSSALAQRRNQQQQQQQKGQAAPQPQIGPAAATQQEAEAFEAARIEADPAKKVGLADNFLSKFPNSELTGFVQRFRMESLSRMGRHKEAIAAAETGLAAEIKYMEDLIKRADAPDPEPQANQNNRNRDRNAPPPPAPKPDKNSPEFQGFAAETERAILYYYQTIMTSYQQLNDAAKTIEYGEKALGQDPEDLLTLLTLSSVMAERPPTDEKAKTEQMNRVVEMAKIADSKVSQLQLPPEQKAGLLSTVHSTLGLANLHLRKYGDAQKEYLAALESNKTDSVAYFRLGIAYAQDRRPDQAMDALAKSVFLKGVAEAQARDILKDLYVQKNKSEQGIEDFIKNAGQKIGQ